MGPMDVSATMAAWQEFFVVIAGAAAVLLGLVFVGESIQAAGAAGSGHHWDLAFSSATSLFYALIAALVMLVPEGRPVAQGVMVICFGGLGFGSSRGALRTARSGTWSRPQLIFRFALPLVAMIVLIAAGIGLALGWVPAVWWIAGAALAHIVTGTQNAWDLLLGVTVKTD